VIPKNNDMRFEVTTKCNYNCIICPHHKLNRNLEIMSFALFKKIFDKINAETAQYNTMTFSGMGEALLDPTLDKKLEYAKKRKKDLAVLLLTNGSLLTLKKFKRLESLGLSSVRISFYGDNPESYTKVHGITNKNMFYNVRDNLLAISKAKRKTKLILTFNLVKGGNEGAVENWIKLWEDRVDLTEVWRPHNWVDAKKYRKVQRKKLKTCGRPFEGPLQIQADGTVNMCCFDFDGKLTLGDLKTQSLKEIFSSPLFKKIVACHSSGNFSGSGLICTHCDQRNADKTGVMIYNSHFDVNERVKMLSTTYRKVI